MNFVPKGVVYQKKKCIFAAELDASVSNRCKKAFVKGHS